SIFIIGFEKGITEWKEFLKPGGYMAVTEACWLKSNPPQELIDFWMECYPGILMVEENISIIEKCGYSLLEHFTLPEDAWWDYYNPLQKRIPALREKYSGNDEALELIDATETEIFMYQKYSEWYGYEFFIMKKND
ncbi:SAM-dependent methyltransferase, partial [bacterium]|nr:SAM-dependent methyltransferase [bacterium]